METWGINSDPMPIPIPVVRPAPRKGRTEDFSGVECTRFGNNVGVGGNMGKVILVIWAVGGGW